MNCQIGQHSRCLERGCEWLKGFEVSCDQLANEVAVNEKLKFEKLFCEKVMSAQDSEKGVMAMTSIKQFYEQFPPVKTLVPKKVKPPIVGTTIVYRGKKIQVSGRDTTKRKAVYARSNGICYLCGEPLKYEEMTFDHVIPRSKGGTNAQTNLRAAHWICNNERGDKPITP